MADRDSQITFRTQAIEQQLLKIQEGKQSVGISQPETKSKYRLNSLDILRGLTMMGMIIVDCRGPDAPWFIKHVAWNGLSPADFIFPSFVFIMGMAVPLSLSKNKPFGIKSLIRIIGLFAIGVFLNLADAKFDFTQFRILGILQRLSVCYLLIVFVHFVTFYGDKNFRFLGFLITLCFGLVYLIFMLTFENNSIECPHSLNLSKFCNYGAYLDRQIFGQKHMIYPNDPEGLFTNLSAFLNGYIGYRFCLIMQDNKNQTKKILSLWLIFSLLLGSMVYPLTFLMPLNKKIWSISFVFLTAAASGLALVIITYLVDVLGLRHPRYAKIVNKIIQPSIWLGLNPLAIFVFMEALAILLEVYIVIDDVSAASHFYNYAFLSWIGNKEVASTIFPVFFLLIWTLVAGLMYKFKVFIRL